MLSTNEHLHFYLYRLTIVLLYILIYQYGAEAPLPICYKSPRTKVLIFGVWYLGISGSTASKEIKSNDLDSSWASDHWYTHQIISFTVTMLQLAPNFQQINAIFA